MNVSLIFSVDPYVLAKSTRISSSRLDIAKILFGSVKVIFETQLNSNDVST